MKTITIDDVAPGGSNIAEGDRIAFIDSAGRIKIGTVKFKKVIRKATWRGQKPDAVYAYAQYRAGRKVKSKYITKMW